MELKIERKWRKADYSIGNLYINGVKVCNTLEDTDRGLYDWMSEDYIRQKKVKDRTAIPYGKYKVILSYSPKFSPKTFYKTIGNGFLPEVLKVKGFIGIRMHVGNTHADSSGCVLLGKNTKVGKVLESQKTFKMVMEKYIIPAWNKGEQITLEITQ